jgi:ribonucleotide reductase alpha subunit
MTIRYKFNEDKILADIKEYIDSTYDQHYSQGKYQATDMIIDAGHGEGFSIDRYFTGEETHAQEAFARASVFGATFKGVTDFELAQRLYNYSSRCWFMFSTPILSNGGTSRGLPISCFLNYVPDSRTGLSSHYDENIWLASSGGGIGGYWGDVRSNGVSLLVQSPLCML